jgi:hypothetical protein
MLTLNQKIDYLVTSAFRYFEVPVCPSCGSKINTLVDRKYIVTRLFKCSDCKLQFRHPIERIEEGKKFYQKKYTEGDGITTEMPSLDALKELKGQNFSQFKDDRSAVRLDEIFKALNSENKKICDYGSSWGYMSYQLKNLGYQVNSFEISTPRADFGNKHLQLNIKSEYNQLEKNQDVVFSSHVIEHVPSVKQMLELKWGLVKEGGYLIVICPNGSRDLKNANPESFHEGWGKVHPNYLNEELFEKFFESKPFFITSSPFNLTQIKDWDQNNSYTSKVMDGYELLVIIKK